MSEALHLNDLFWTFQGEGLHAGRRALFVRMPYCNLACTWCDTTFNSFTRWSEENFVKYATSEPSAFAVLTGGEPMLNKHSPRVVKILRDLGFYVATETNGTVAPNCELDFYTVSPKKFSSEKGLPPYYIHPEMYRAANEFKYVVDAGFDFDVLDRHRQDIGKRHSLSPEFTNLHANLQEIFSYIERNPQWRISLQTHKWMNVK